MLWAVLSLSLGLDLCGSRTGCELTLTAEPKLLAPARDAAAELKLSPKEAAEEPRPTAAKKPADARLAFRVSERDGLLVVTLRSLDRPIDQYGEARVKVVKVKKEWEARAYKSAIRTAMEKAAVDFRLRAREADLGRRSVTFSVRINGLSSGAQGEAHHTLDCFKSQLELAGPVTEAVEHDGYLDETVEYLPRADEPRDNLPYFAQRAKGWLTGGPKAPCTVQLSALDGFRTRVDVDEVNRAVVVGFSK
ncbi:MAG: hypothetical protein QM723_38085 [Myxococcaceae bacterium]